MSLYFHTGTHLRPCETPASSCILPRSRVVHGYELGILRQEPHLLCTLGAAKFNRGRFKNSNRSNTDN